MASIQAPFPPSGSFISSVYESARAVRESFGIEVSSSAVDRFLASLSQETYLRLKDQHGVSFPLRFPTVTSEVNFLAVLSLLNTLSGYREAFHKATGCGAYQNVMRLLLGLYITGSDDSDGTSGSGSLSAVGLRDLSAAKVADILNVSLHQKKPHETIPGLTVGIRGGEINEAVELIVKLCNQTGTRLIETGYPSLGVLALEILKQSEKILEQKGNQPAADYFVEKLVQAIPGFQDMSLIDGTQPVYIFKKAFFFLQALHLRITLSSQDSSLVPKIPNPSCLPMFVDNVLPTMLVHYGILDLSQSSLPCLQKWSQDSQTFRQRIESESNQSKTETHVVPGPCLSKKEAYIIRAAAIDAGRIIVQKSSDLALQDSQFVWLQSMTEADLDGYLWAVAKDNHGLRSVPRMVEKRTIMY